MAEDVVIRAEGLGKKYVIGHAAERERYVALRDVLARNVRNFGRTTMDLLRGRPMVVGDEVEEFWALRDVSFEIRRGEIVGVIGRNGAGKSTLLKILSRITEPTEGRVAIRGRVASLLEVGTGFHPELTGRENVYLNGSILGMTHAEIRRKFDEMVAFAEIEKFLDTPVKRYSSGMYVRLAFAVAAHLDPEILIVDEVLAVGDVEFQKKSLGKMGEVARGGRTVVLVSHNIGAIRALTETCMCLQSGRLLDFGPSTEVSSRYLSTQVGSVSTGDLSSFRREKSLGSVARIGGIVATRRSRTCEDEENDRVSLAVEIEISGPIRDAHVDFTIKNSRGERTAILFSRDSGVLLSADSGVRLVTAEFAEVPLAPGQYFVDVGVAEGFGRRTLDVIVDFPIFLIPPEPDVTSWTDRPWGALHFRNVDWTARDVSSSREVARRQCS